MAEQRQPFRFRLPWLPMTAAAPPPTPQPQPSRPAPEIQAPARPTTAIPIQRAPFRFAGIAPAQPPSQAQTTPRTEPQPPPSSLAATESRVASQPASPSRAAQTRASSVPPPESRVTSPTVSPSRGTTPTPSISQEKESKPAESLQLLQEPQQKIQIKSEIVSEGETTFKPETAAAQPMTTVVPTSRATPGAPAAPQKLESIPIPAGHPRSPTESEKEMKGTEGKKEDLAKEAKPEEGKEVAREPVKEEKTDSSAVRPSKELLGGKQEKREIFERKKTLTTSKSDEKHIKTVSSTHAKDRNILRNHQKPDISNGERAPLHKEIKEDISKFVHKLATGHSKQPMDDRAVSIVTVAGENRGASMQIGAESTKKDGSVPMHRGYKLKSDESPETTTDGEESSKGRNPRDSTTKNYQATRAYINGNVQSINNSIMFDSSVNERNPGVHLVLSHNLPEPTKPTTKPGTLETHKATFSVTPAETHTYQPTVRSQCLRGTFMEPCDSDPDNPEKPRRHGCLYNCGENSKDILVL